MTTVVHSFRELMMFDENSAPRLQQSYTDADTSYETSSVCSDSVVR